MTADDRRSGEREPQVGAPAARPAVGRAAGRQAGSMSGVAYAGLGFQFAAALVVFFFVGQWLDRRFGTAPVFLLTCVLVGSGSAFYAMYRRLMAAQRRDAAARASARRAEGAPERAPAGTDGPESRP